MARGGRTLVCKVRKCWWRRCWPLKPWQDWYGHRRGGWVLLLMGYRRFEVVWIWESGGGGKRCRSSGGTRIRRLVIDISIDNPIDDITTPFSGCSCGIMPSSSQTFCSIFKTYLYTLNRPLLSFSSAAYLKISDLHNLQALHIQCLSLKPWCSHIYRTSVEVFWKVWGTLIMCLWWAILFRI